jgi:hypothetical protein
VASWSERKERKKKQEDFKDKPDPARKVSKPKVSGNEDDVASATKNEVERNEALKKRKGSGRG